MGNQEERVCGRKPGHSLIDCPQDYLLYLVENEVVTKCEGDGNTYLPSPFVALFKVSCTRLDLERLLSGSACLRFTGWSNHYC